MVVGMMHAARPEVGCHATGGSVGSDLVRAGPRIEIAPRYSAELLSPQAQRESQEFSGYQ